MARVGLGTYKLADPEVHVECISKAITEAGYRNIDTAMMYGNEGVVGAGINDAIKSGKVPREEIFVTTKIW